MDPELNATFTRIETLTTGMMTFWSDVDGWAPPEAAELLNRSMLNWQISLVHSIRRWSDAESEGDLILAWTNLGALVEGQMRLFLSAYYRTYVDDIAVIRRRGEILDPDECRLEDLRQFFINRIWTRRGNFNDYVHLVQQRRNAIHAFRSREIGTFDEWKSLLPTHLRFVHDINNRLPYPDDELYKPRESR